jgi:hypothetical protein
MGKVFPSPPPKSRFRFIRRFTTSLVILSILFISGFYFYFSNFTKDVFDSTEIVYRKFTQTAIELTNLNPEGARKNLVEAQKEITALPKFLLFWEILFRP